MLKPLVKSLVANGIGIKPHESRPGKFHGNVPDSRSRGLVCQPGRKAVVHANNVPLLSHAYTILSMSRHEAYGGNRTRVLSSIRMTAKWMQRCGVGTLDLLGGYNLVIAIGLVERLESWNKDKARSEGRRETKGRNAGGANQASRAVSTAPAVSQPHNKRPAVKTDYDNISRARGIQGVLESLLEDDGTDFADANKAFMAARKSFSEAQYEDVAPFFELNMNIDNPFEDWNDLDVPQVLLPTSVLREVCTCALQSHVIPGSASDAAFLAGTLVCFFGGILRDKLEQHLPGTALSSGGREIFCREERLLFVRELKHDVGAKFTEAPAQVLCEFFAAWHLNRRYNKDVPVDHLVPVRACLYDASSAYFIGYDGSQFSRHVVASPAKPATIEEHVLSSLEITQYTFGVLLEGYAEAIQLYGKRSISRGRAGDATARGSHRTVVVNPQSPWTEAVNLGLKSTLCFQRAHQIQSDIAAERGLQLLQERWCFPILHLRILKGPDIETHHGSTPADLREDPDPTWEPQVPENILSLNFKEVTLHIRESWEAATNSPAVDPFDRLSHYAANGLKDDQLKEIGRILCPLDAGLFTNKLSESQEDGLWIL
ncbi:hypothetical protein DFH09DRAFT_1411173 [Mycena vulgaris]|nr:hypothetical protein DFH09DRAFT_1411173 [Mycena vulgaris]